MIEDIKLKIILKNYIRMIDDVYHEMKRTIPEDMIQEVNAIFGNGTYKVYPYLGMLEEFIKRLKEDVNEFGE